MNSAFPQTPTALTHTFHCIQLNAQKKLSSHELATHQGVDVLFMQEPSSRCLYNPNPDYLTIQNPSPATPTRACILHHKSIRLVHVPIESCGIPPADFTIATTITTPKLTLVSLYIEPAVEISPYVAFLDKITKTLGPRIILCTDTNSWNEWWGEKPTSRNRHAPQWKRGRALAEALSKARMTVMRPSEATFNGGRGSSYIDVTATTVPTLIANYHLPDAISLSDHRLIRFEIRTNPQPLPQNPRLINPRKVDWQIYDAQLSKRLAAFSLTDGKADLESSIRELTDLIYKSALEASPRPTKTKWNKRFQLPYWNKELDRAWNQMENRRQRRRRNPSCPHSRLDYLDAKENFEKLLKSSRTDHFNDFLEKSSFAEVYKTLKLETAPPPCLLKDKHGRFIPSERCADTFADALYPQITNSRESLDTPVNSSLKTDSVAFITLAELEYSIGQLAPYKAPGIDGIHPILIKKGLSQLAPHILSILNTCLVCRAFPKIWKTAKVILIPKGGRRDMTQTKSWRPISVIPSLARLFERILNRRMQFLAREAKWWPEPIHGSRPGRSCNSALLSLLQAIRCPDKKNQVSMLVCLDFSGAFDKARHETITKELEIQKDCPEYISKLVKSFLADRTAIVHHFGATATRDVRIGVPQGSSLSPTLWNLQSARHYRLVKEILHQNGVKESNYQWFNYVDDTFVLVKAEDEDKLVQAARIVIKAAKEAADIDGLVLSPEKTIILPITRKNKLPRPIVSKEKICSTPSQPRFSVSPLTANFNGPLTSSQFAARL